MGSSKSKPFSKKQYRPWDKLLEESVQDGAPFEDSFEDGETREEVELEQVVEVQAAQATLVEDVVPNDAQGDEAPLTKLDSNYDTLSEEHLSQVNNQLTTFIEEKELQREDLLNQINDKSESPMLIGGFFEPRSVCVQQTSDHGRQISRLLHDLRSREEELINLNNNLKVIQAVEKAEQAELEKRHEHQLRLAAEEQMKKTLDKAQAATQELQKAIQQTKAAEAAQKQEETARRQAERQADKERHQAKNALLKTEAAEQARLEAEALATQKVEIAAQAEKQYETVALDKHRLERELINLHDQVEELTTARKAAETAQHSAETLMQETLVKLDQAQQDARTQLEQTQATAQAHLESEIEALTAAYESEKASLTQELTSKYESQIESLEASSERAIEERNHFEAALQEQLVALDNTQRELKESQDQGEKLRSIIKTEQDLRRQAEAKVKLATEQLEEKVKEANNQREAAEKAREQAEQKAKAVEEKAKRAIAHANQTVMNFLDTPVDENSGTKEE